MVGEVDVKRGQPAAHHLYRLDPAERLFYPGQFDAQDFATAVGLLLGGEEVVIVFPRMPVREILSAMVDVVDRFAAYRIGDIAHLAAVDGCGRNEELDPLLLRLCRRLCIPIAEEIYLHEHVKPGVNAFKHRRTMARRRGAKERRLRLHSCNRIRERGERSYAKLLLDLRPPIRRAIHPNDFQFPDNWRTSRPARKHRLHETDSPPSHRPQANYHDFHGDNYIKTTPLHVSWITFHKWETPIACQTCM